MKGMYHVIVQNKRLRYEFDIKRNITKKEGIQNVVIICTAVRCICGVDLHTGKDRHRGCELESCNCHQNSGGGRDGMGDGVPDECTGRHRTDRKKELAVSYLIRTCDRGIMAVLLPGATAWRSF